MRNYRRFVFSFFVCMAACLVRGSYAAAGPWGNPDYLYRYVFWGLREELSPSDAYKMFPYRTIETRSPPYEFSRATTGALPAEPGRRISWTRPTRPGTIVSDVGASLSTSRDVRHERSP